MEAIDHVNIVAKNIHNLKKFYEDVIGMEVYKEAVIEGDWVDYIVGLKNVKANVIFLKLDTGSNLELIEYYNPIGKTVDSLDIPNTFGIRHIAFRVSNIKNIYEKCKKQGVKFQSDIYTVPTAQVPFGELGSSKKKRLCYLRDPENNLLEFCSYE